MTEKNTATAGLSGLEPVLESIAQWVRLCRIALGTRNELAVASPEEIARVAGELGVRPPEIAQAITDWSQEAVLLPRMLAALGIDPEASALKDDVMIALQRVCAGCAHKPECARNLSHGATAENFYGYCPNALTLDSIYVETTFSRL